MAPSCADSHCTPCHILTVKQNASFTEECLWLGGEIINFIKSWPLNTCVFNILCDEKEVSLKYRGTVSSWVKARVQLFLLGAKLVAFFLAQTFTRRNDCQTNCWLFRHGYLADIFPKWIKWAYCFKKNNWQCLSPGIKLKLSSGNQNLGKLLFPSWVLWPLNSWRPLWWDWQWC